MAEHKFGVKILEKIDEQLEEIRKRALIETRFKLFEEYFTEDKIIKDIAHHGYCSLSTNTKPRHRLDETLFIYRDFAEWFPTKFDTDIFNYKEMIDKIYSDIPIEIRIYLK